jgi:hypothetical protein
MPRRPDADVERGLTALALCNGRVPDAVRLIAESGDPIPESTIRDWQREKVDLYEHIRARELPRIKQAAAERHMQLAAKHADLSDRIVDKMRAAVEADDLKPNQLAPALHTANIGSGVHIDKAKGLRGEPDVVVEKPPDLEQAAARLRKLLGVRPGEPLVIDMGDEPPVIDMGAVEDAEVVLDPALPERTSDDG